jgi:hypothetical protein
MCSDHADVPIVMQKHVQLKVNLVDHWLKEMWAPSSTDSNLWIISCGAYLRERSINAPHINLASLKVMTSVVMSDLDREVIIHACKKFSSWIEAAMEATGVFIK